jgi:phosphoribosyl 1,2-cyclic phosphodiesterase
VWDGKLVEEVVDRLGVEKMDGGKGGRKAVWRYIEVIFITHVHVSR